MAIRKNLSHVDALDDVVELLERLQIELRSLESIDWTVEGQVIVEQRARRVEVPLSKSLLLNQPG